MAAVTAQPSAVPPAAAAVQPPSAAPAVPGVRPGQAKVVRKVCPAEAGDAAPPTGTKDEAQAQESAAKAKAATSAKPGTAVKGITGAADAAVAATVLPVAAAQAVFGRQPAAVLRKASSARVQLGAPPLAAGEKEQAPVAKLVQVGPCASAAGALQAAPDVLGSQVPLRTGNLQDSESRAIAAGMEAAVHGATTAAEAATAELKAEATAAKNKNQLATLPKLDTHAAAADPIAAPGSAEGLVAAELVPTNLTGEAQTKVDITSLTKMVDSESRSKLPPGTTGMAPFHGTAGNTAVVAPAAESAPAKNVSVVIEAMGGGLVSKAASPVKMQLRGAKVIATNLGTSTTRTSPDVESSSMAKRHTGSASQPLARNPDYAKSLEHCDQFLGPLENAGKPGAEVQTSAELGMVMKGTEVHNAGGSEAVPAVVQVEREADWTDPACQNEYFEKLEVECPGALNSNSAMKSSAKEAAAFNLESVGNVPKQVITSDTMQLEPYLGEELEVGDVIDTGAASKFTPISGSDTLCSESGKDNSHQANTKGGMEVAKAAGALSNAHNAHVAEFQATGPQLMLVDAAAVGAAPFCDRPAVLDPASPLAVEMPVAKMEQIFGSHCMPTDKSNQGIELAMPKTCSMGDTVEDTATMQATSVSTVGSGSIAEVVCTKAMDSACVSKAAAAAAKNELDWEDMVVPAKPEAVSSSCIPTLAAVTAPSAATTVVTESPGFIPSGEIGIDVVSEFASKPAEEGIGRSALEMEEEAIPSTPTAAEAGITPVPVSAPSTPSVAEAAPEASAVAQDKKSLTRGLHVSEPTEPEKQNVGTTNLENQEVARLSAVSVATSASKIATSSSSSIPNPVVPEAVSVSGIDMETSSACADVQTGNVAAGLVAAGPDTNPRGTVIMKDAPNSCLTAVATDTIAPVHVTDVAAVSPSPEPPLANASSLGVLGNALRAAGAAAHAAAASVAASGQLPGWSGWFQRAGRLYFDGMALLATSHPGPPLIMAASWLMACFMTPQSE
jgi:hypothetical protein